MVVYNVKVRNRIIELVSQTEYPVGGNKGDKVIFDFDDEWNAEENKKAVFVWCGKYKTAEIVENHCYVPPIYGSKKFRLGVTLGDSLDDEKYLSTTTITIDCKLSIRDYSLKPHSESGDGSFDDANGAAEEAKKAAKEAKESAALSLESAKRAEQAEANAKSLVGDIGNIGDALDELLSYAQSIVDGGAS